jgi:UDP-N-acetylglucosamine pyrophosphorylase
MTSPINHDETVQYFIKNNYFGARRESVIFFEQAVLPAVD